MSRLQQASDRLKAALERLETVAESAIEAKSQTTDADTAEVETLRGQLSAARRLRPALPHHRNGFKPP